MTKSTTTTTTASTTTSVFLDDAEDEDKFNNSLVTKKFTSYHKLVDYFIVCGLGRSIVVNDIDKTYQTEIIDRYPPNNYVDVAFPSHMWMFCFPSGLSIKETMEEPSISMFCLTELDGARFYASSLIYYKEIEKSKMENDQYEQLFKPVSITLLSRYMCYGILKKLLGYIYLYSINNGTDETNTIPIERIVSHIVNDLPRPISGFTFKLNFPEIVSNNLFNGSNRSSINNLFKNSISNNNNNSLFDVSNLSYSLSNIPSFPSLDIPFSLLFNLIGINNVVTLFSAIIQERKVLFLSNYNSLLTVASETLINLLYPFKWIHIYVPVLPDLLYEYLDAPTPFIIGMLKHKNQPKVDYSDIFVVDLDLQLIISKPNGFKNNLPENELNRLEKLLKQIMFPDIEQLCQVFTTGNTRNNTTVDISTKIRSAFLGFFIKFFYDVDDYRCLLRKYPKPISTFNKSSYLMKHRDPEVVNFLTSLIETPAVTSFFDEDYDEQFNNTNNNNISISNPSSTFFNLVCKQYKDDLMFYSNSILSSSENNYCGCGYDSVITCILETTNVHNGGSGSSGDYLMMETINVPTPDSSELNPLLSIKPDPLLQFPDLNVSLFSKRNEFSRENIDTKPRPFKLTEGAPKVLFASTIDLFTATIDTNSSGSGVGGIGSRKSSFSSNSSFTSHSPPPSFSTSPLTLSSLNKSTANLSATSSPLQLSRRPSIAVLPIANNNNGVNNNNKPPNVVISNSKGEVENVVSTNQLEDDYLVREYIEKYIELIFEDQQPSITTTTTPIQTNTIIDFEQQKLLLDLFKFGTSREHFKNSLIKILGAKGGNNKSLLDSGWRLQLLVEIMKRIFSECNNAADFSTASSIISSTKDIHFKRIVQSSNGNHQTQQEPLFIHFQGLRLWKNLYFWESSFLDSLSRMRLESLPESFNSNTVNDWSSKSTTEKSDAIQLEEELLFKSLSMYSYLMIRLKLTIAETIKFINRMVVICNINDEHLNTLTSLIEKLYNADPTNQQLNEINQLNQDNLIQSTGSNGGNGSSGTGNNSADNNDYIQNDEISNVIQYNQKKNLPELFENLNDIDDLNPGGDIKYFSSSVKRNIDIEKNGTKLYYQKLIEMKRKIGYSSSGNSGGNNGTGCINGSSDDDLKQQQQQNKRATFLNSSLGSGSNTVSPNGSSLSLSLSSIDLNQLQQYQLQQQQQQQDLVLYDKKDGYSVMTLKGSGSSVTCVSVLNKRSTIINGTTQGNILVWNFNDGKCLQKLTNHKSSVTCIGVDQQSNESIFASGSRDKTLRIWNYNGSEWSCNSTLAEHTDEITSLEYKGNTILTGSNDSTMIVWDVRSNRKVHRFTGHEGNILSTVMFDSGYYAVTTSTDTTARAWDIRTMKHLQTFSEHHDWATKCVLVPGTNRFFTGSFDCTVKMWDLNSSNSIKTFSGHGGGINALAFNGDTKVLVSGSGDGFLKAWDIQTGYAIKSFKGHKDEILSILFEGDTLITSSQDQTVRIWDVNSGVCQKVLRGHTDWIVSLSKISNTANNLTSSGNNNNNGNGNKLTKFISGSWDSTVKVWDIDQQQQSSIPTSTSSSSSFFLPKDKSDRGDKGDKSEKGESNRIVNVITHQPNILSASLPSNQKKAGSSNQSSSSGGSIIFKKTKVPSSATLTSSSGSINPTTSASTSTSPTSASPNSTSPIYPSSIANNPFIIGNLECNNNNNNNNNIPIITTTKVIPSNNNNKGFVNIGSVNSNGGSNSSGSLSTDTPIGSMSSSLSSSSFSSLSSSSSGGGGSQSWRVGSPLKRNSNNSLNNNNNRQKPNDN